MWCRVDRHKFWGGTCYLRIHLVPWGRRQQVPTKYHAHEDHMLNIHHWYRAPSSIRRSVSWKLTTPISRAVSLDKHSTDPLLHSMDLEGLIIVTVLLNMYAMNLKDSEKTMW
jgi:hypothetical protein